MKEFVLVSIGVNSQEDLDQVLKIAKESDQDLSVFDISEYTGYYRVVSAKACSAFLTQIRLQQNHLFEHLKVSYISEDLKDKYRR